MSEEIYETVAEHTREFVKIHKQALIRVVASQSGYCDASEDEEGGVSESVVAYVNPRLIYAIEANTNDEAVLLVGQEIYNTGKNIDKFLEEYGWLFEIV